MKPLNKITILLMISFGFLDAKDAKNGEDLYYFSDCTNCHNPSNFSEENRKAKNYKELHRSVDGCRYSTNVNWFDKERDDVVHYLNTKYYKFKTVQ